MNEQEQTDQAAETTKNNNPIDICYQTNRDTAEYCLRILNWFFDHHVNLCIFAECVHGAV